MTSRQIQILRAFIVALVVGIAVLGFALARFAVTGGSRTPRTELERAVLAAEEAVRANPQDEPSRIKLAAVYLERGDISAAIEQAKNAARLDPKDPSPLYVLGLAEMQRGDPKAAITYLKKASDTKGQLAQFYQDTLMALGRAYEKDGNPTDAIASMSRALNYGPENVILLYERGQMYERAQNWAGAMDDYAAALEYVPDHEPSRKAFDALKAAHPDVFEKLRKQYEATSGVTPSGK
jgi:tetratricopeptide (TPR) repeat protein